MQLKDMNINAPNALDLALEKIESLSKNQHFKDMFFRDDIKEKFNLRSGDGVAAAQSFITKRILSHIPALMKHAKKELADYFAFCNGISAEEYEKELTVGKLYADVYGMINDETFLNFFYSFAETEAQA